MMGYDVFGDLNPIPKNMEVFAVYKDSPEIKERMTHTAKLKIYNYINGEETTIDYVYGYCSVSSLGYFESPMDISNFDRFEVNFITNKKEVQTILEEKQW